MPTRIECPACTQMIRVPDKYLNAASAAKVKCPKCQSPFQIEKGALRPISQPPPRSQPSVDADDRIHPLVWLTVGGGVVALIALIIGATIGSRSKAEDRNTVQTARTKVDEPSDSRAVLQSPNTTSGSIETDKGDVGTDTTDWSKTAKVAGEIDASKRGIVAAAEQKPDLSTKAIVAMCEAAVVTLIVEGADQSQVTTGSGFVVDDAGLIATNYHVVEGARYIHAIFSNKEDIDVAGFTAIQPNFDLATLKVFRLPKGTKALRLSANSPQKGDDVFTFGAPQGISSTFSKGCVSGQHNGLEMRKLLGRDYSEYSTEIDWIQSTAPISHGNSGGPLISIKGEVVGVNTLSNEAGQNLNFAVSAKHVKELLDSHGLFAKPLALLPESKRGKAMAKLEEDQKKKSEANDKQLQKIVRANGIQRELDRLTIQITQTRSELSQFDHDLLVLQRDYDTVEARGWRIESSYQTTNAQLSSVTNDYNRGNGDELTLRNQINALRAQAADLKAKGTELLTLFNKLKEQLNMLAAQKSTKQQVLDELESQALARKRELNGN